jgi:hypothetical protein
MRHLVGDAFDSNRPPSVCDQSISFLSVISRPRSYCRCTIALLTGEDAEAVVLDLVQPAWPGRRAIDQCELAWAEEADWRISSPTGREIAPGFQHVQLRNLSASN